MCSLSFPSESSVSSVTSLPIQSHSHPILTKRDTTPTSSFLTFDSLQSSQSSKASTSMAVRRRSDRPTLPRSDQDFSPFGIPPILLTPFTRSSGSQQPPLPRPGQSFGPFSTAEEDGRMPCTPDNTGSFASNLFDRRPFIGRGKGNESTFGKRDRRETMKLPIMAPPSSTDSPKTENDIDIGFEEAIRISPVDSISKIGHGHTGNNTHREGLQSSPSPRISRSIDLGPFENGEGEMSLVEVLELLSGHPHPVDGPPTPASKSISSSRPIVKSAGQVTYSYPASQYSAPARPSTDRRSLSPTHAYRPPPSVPLLARMSSFLDGPLPPVPTLSPIPTLGVPLSPHIETVTIAPPISPKSPERALLSSRSETGRRSTSFSGLDDAEGQTVPLLLASEVFLGDQEQIKELDVILATPRRYVAPFFSPNRLILTVRLSNLFHPIPVAFPLSAAEVQRDR